MNDSELLRRFVDEQSEEAFAELVRRRIGVVYAAALRQLHGDAHRAEDVTQLVFIDLARKARSLQRHPALLGWLYTSTHFAAAKMIRSEQRRTRREEEAQVMSELSASRPAESNWEQVRSELDAAMHELGERDRQTVLLRYFAQQSFARIGEELGMSENAAQKAADRALEKLQAALARRGVTSTAAALGLVLTSQAASAAPPALTASVTGAALTAASATSGALGVFASLGAGKLLGTVAVTAAVFSGGVAVVEHRRARDMGNALTLAEQQNRSLAARVADLDTRTRQAESRAAEAEKDNETLLRAVEAFKTQANRPAQTASADASPPAEDEGAAYARAYQQALARRRADEARNRATVAETISRMDDASAYHRLINIARELAAEASFQEAVRMYNQAMTIKPAALEVTPEIRRLQSELQAQNVPVDVTLVSDVQTWVGITNFRQPSKFLSVLVKLMPGNYQVVGRRRGYRDVTINLVVRSGQSVGPITVICTERVSGN